MELKYAASAAGIEASIRAEEIPVGTIFRGTVAATTRVFLKAYGIILDLENPRATWSIEGIVVKNYEPLEAHVIVTGRARPAKGT